MKISDRTARKNLDRNYPFIVVFDSKSKKEVMKWYMENYYPYSYHSNPAISKVYILEQRNGNSKDGYYMAFKDENLYSKIIKELKIVKSLEQIETELDISNSNISVFKNINFEMADSI